MSIPGDEQFNYSANRELESAAKVRALESLLIEKGIIGSETVNKVLSYFESNMGPFNGARLVAKAWVDPGFKELLIRCLFS
jgi:nitrile hydratase